MGSQAVCQRAPVDPLVVHAGPRALWIGICFDRHRSSANEAGECKHFVDVFAQPLPEFSPNAGLHRKRDLMYDCREMLHRGTHD
jgi:hypothetical protein